MHSANFTALSRALSVLSAPLLLVPELPVDEPLEQPAPIRATMVRAASVRRF
jgi:hypothetical protein